MKKLYFFLVFLVAFSNSAQCLIFEWAEKAVGKVIDKAEDIADSVWKKTMLKQAIDSYTTMKKNYDESVAFYEEMKRISKNPNELTNYTATQFTERGRDALNRQYRQAQIEYDTSYYAKKGWVSKLEDRGNAYIEQKLDFSKRQEKLINSAKDIEDNYKLSQDVMKDNRKKQKQFADEIIPGAKSKNKDEVERARLATELLMAETLLSLERTQAKTLETMNALYKQWRIGQISQLEREKEFAESITNLRKMMAEAQRGKSKTAVDTLNRLLR